ncbi:MAG: response regulator transcription factor [bacterium]
MNIRILVADDHGILRDGLRSLIEAEPNLVLVGEAADGRTAIELASKLSPDVAVVDVAMGGLNGIETTRQIRKIKPDIKVLALSVHSDRSVVAEMLLAGASGYVQKSCAFDELARAIRTVIGNQVYLSAEIADVVTKDYVRRLSESKSSAFSLLSDREREVLQLLAEGKSTKQVASTLHVSAKTVETHRMQIMRKLKATSLAELVRYALREKLTFLDP